MKIRIEAVSYNIEKYEKILNKYNLDGNKIILNTMEDMVNLSSELGHSIIVNKDFPDEDAWLTIYDDYRE